MKRKYLRRFNAAVAASVLAAFVFQQSAFCLEQVTVGYGKEYPNIQNAVDEHPLPNPLTEDVEFIVDVGPDGYVIPHDISYADFGDMNGKEVVFTGVASQTISGKRTDFLVALGGSQVGILASTGDISAFGHVSELTPTPGIKEVYVENGVYDYTVALLTDHVGTVLKQVQLKTSTPDQASYSMYPYGQPLPGPDGLQKSGDKAQGINGFSFTGKSLDVGLRSAAEQDRAGLYYFGARFFDPELGIWLTPDPANTFINAYSYGNDPINSIDPDGREPLTIGAILVGALIVGAVIGAGFGAYQGYKMAEASGSSGWAYVGYIAGGTVIGAISGAVGGVTAAGAGILTAYGCVACAPIAAYAAGVLTGSFTGSVLNKVAYGSDLSVNFGPYNKNLEGGEDGGFPQYGEWDGVTGYIDNGLVTLAYLGPVLAVSGAVSPKMNPFAPGGKMSPESGVPAAKNVPDENTVPQLNIKKSQEITPIKKDVAQVTKNAINGGKAEIKFRNAVLKSGKFEIVGEKVYIKTSLTNRIVDFILADKKTGETMIFEIKTGGAKRSLSQLNKDALIETQGGVAHGVQALKYGLDGSMIKIPTRELNVPLP